MAKWEGVWPLRAVVILIRFACHPDPAKREKDPFHFAQCNLREESGQLRDKANAEMLRCAQHDRRDLRVTAWGPSGLRSLCELRLRRADLHGKVYPSQREW